MTFSVATDATDLFTSLRAGVTQRIELWKANDALAYGLQSRVAVQLEARALAEKHYLRKWRLLETTPWNELVPPRRVEDAGERPFFAEAKSRAVLAPTADFVCAADRRA